MKQITLREFSQNPSKYIKKLPIILTRYNLPIATIVPYKDIKTRIVNVDTTLEAKVSSTMPAHYANILPKEQPSDYPATLYGKPLSGKKGTCPVCGEVAPVEFATKHYTDKHEDL